MDWKNQLTKTPYLVLFIFLAAIGIGTASAVMTITLAGDVIIEGNTQIDNNLNVDGIIAGKTINELKQDLLDIQNSLSFMDIVVSNLEDDDISVLLGNGDVTFLPKIDTAVVDVPFGVAIGDLNDDGNQDVVVANRGTDDNEISVLLGKGDGNFLPKTDIVTGDFPVWVAIDDINNDGNKDVVVSNGADNSTSVLLGKGDGTFLPKIDTTVGGDPRVLAIGDLNNDGNQDVVTANELSDDMSVLLGNGDGTFTRTDIGVALFPFGVAIGDINNDGNQDVVTSSSNAFLEVEEVWVFFGEGDGTFGDIHTLSLGTGPQGLAIGDLNNDGFGDVVVSYRDDDSVQILFGGEKLDFPSLITNVNVGDSPIGVAIGDINNDGNQDIAVANNGVPSNVSILIGNGMGGFAKTDVIVGIGPVGIAIGNLGGPTPLD